MRENEQSWICTGGITGRLWYGYLSHQSEGTPGSVNFPYKWVIEREETKHDVNGFKHTHPGFSAVPSLRDMATFHQWVMSFGKPLMCLIEGIDGLKAYLFYDDESNCIRCKTVKQFGQLIVVLLPPKRLYDKPAVVIKEIKPVVSVSKENIPFAVDKTDLSLFEDDDLDDFLCIDWDEYEYGDT